MIRFKYYLTIWLIMARKELVRWSTSGKVFSVFLFAKSIRYTAYFGFLYFLVKSTGGFLGYSQNQTLFFTATYVMVDTIAQFFFRNVYGFRSLVISGDLDLVLVKPINPLFRILLGAPDPMDIITIPPLIFIVYWFGSQLNPTTLQVFYYLLLIANSLLVALALHIFVVAFGIITLEVDHMIMVYRDLSSMGRFPVEIYKEPLKSILTYVVPVGIMVTVPGRALFGLVSLTGILTVVFFAGFLFILSLKFWNFALKKYSSASS